MQSYFIYWVPVFYFQLYNLFSNRQRGIQDLNASKIIYFDIEFDIEFFLLNNS